MSEGERVIENVRNFHSVKFCLEITFFFLNYFSGLRTTLSFSVMISTTVSIVIVKSVILRICLL